MDPLDLIVGKLFVSLLEMDYTVRISDWLEYWGQSISNAQSGNAEHEVQMIGYQLL